MRQSGTKTLVTEEPYAFIAHVRVCGGAGWVTTGSTRKPTGHSVRFLVGAGWYPVARRSPPALGVKRDERTLSTRSGHSPAIKARVVRSTLHCLAILALMGGGI